MRGMVGEVYCGSVEAIIDCNVKEQRIRSLDEVKE